MTVRCNFLLKKLSLLSLFDIMRSKSVEIIKLEKIYKALQGLALKYFYHETLSQLELAQRLCYNIFMKDDAKKLGENLKKLRIKKDIS